MNIYFKPLISVILPNYNGMPYLKSAISSILLQTYNNFELIVIDDGSKDNSWNYLGNLKDKRLILIRNKTNQGIAKSLNKAIILSKGKYIARMDADDISKSDRFTKQIKFMEAHPEISVCGTYAQVINNHGKIIGRINYPSDPETIKKIIPFINPLIHPSVIIRADFFKQFGLFSKKYEFAEDYELWLRTRDKAKFANINKYLICVRQSNNQRSHSKKMEIMDLKIKYDYFKKNPFNFIFIAALMKKVFTIWIPSSIKLKIFDKIRMPK